MTKCLWCETEFEPPSSAPGKLYCTPAHRAKYKRAQAAAALADIVDDLGPYVAEGGLDSYAALVQKVRVKLNAGE